jgi:hypothetical protein
MCFLWFKCWIGKSFVPSLSILFGTPLLGGLGWFWFSHHLCHYRMLCSLVAGLTRNVGKVSLLFGFLLFGPCGKQEMIVFSTTFRWILGRWWILFKDYRGNGSCLTWRRDRVFYTSGRGIREIVFLDDSVLYLAFVPFVTFVLCCCFWLVFLCFLRHCLCCFPCGISLYSFA